MIVLVLIVVGILAGVVLSLVVKEPEEIIGWGGLGGLIGLAASLLLFGIIVVSPFERSYVLNETIEITEVQEVEHREKYIYTDKQGFTHEYYTYGDVSIKDVKDSFRIENYKYKYKNKHLSYLIPEGLWFDEKYIIYREGE